MTLDRLEQSFLDGAWTEFVLPPTDALPGFGRIELEADQVERIRLGHSVPAPSGAEGLACALDPAGRLIAILEATADGQQWHPRKVFLE